MLHWKLTIRKTTKDSFDAVWKELCFIYEYGRKIFKCQEDILQQSAEIAVADWQLRTPKLLTSY